VTGTENTHGESTATEAAESTMLFGAVTVRLPAPHVVTAAAFATVSPAGSVSVRPMKCSTSGLPAGLVIVKVSAVVAPTATELGLKAAAIDGYASTLTDALAVLPGPPSVDDTAPVVVV
jgi:hypothetical protein